MLNVVHLQVGWFPCELASTTIEFWQTPTHPPIHDPFIWLACGKPPQLKVQNSHSYLSLLVTIHTLDLPFLELMPHIAAGTYNALHLILWYQASVTHCVLLRQYTSPQIISLDPISLGFLVYIDAVCRL